VRENLKHQGHLYGMSGSSLKDRIEAILARVGLQDRGDDLVATLSGGMKRRVELAKGLLHQPKLLLLDEPSTGLDPAARLFVWDRIRDLRQAGVTIVLTTHDMDEAAANIERAYGPTLAVLMRSRGVMELVGIAERGAARIGARHLALLAGDMEVAV